MVVSVYTVSLQEIELSVFVFLLNLVWSETILLRCRNSVKSLWDHFLVLPMSSSKSICNASESSKSSSWVKGEYVRGGTCQPWHHQRPFLPPLIFNSLSRGILLGAWKRFESCHKFTTVPLLGAWVGCGTSALHLLKKLAEYSLIFTILWYVRITLSFFTMLGKGFERASSQSLFTLCDHSNLMLPLYSRSHPGLYKYLQQLANAW